jgi:carbonic anhydrase
VILRTAGNNLLDREVLRSLVVGVFLQGIQDIIVLGHTDCGMSKIDLVQLTNAMRARGVVREKLPGVSDIRQWLGAFGNVESNVRETVGHLRASPFLPRDIRVHGLVINSDTGELKVVERGK